MLHVTTTPAQKRATFRAQLSENRTLRHAGAYSPLVAKILEEIGYDGIGITGASVAADLVLPDIGLFTMTELVNRGRQIAQATNLPSLVDVDTGFGEPQSVYRTTCEIEAAGISAMFIEDQILAKRCGHLDNKTLVPIETMQARLRAATDGRTDPNFMIWARTDARAVEGLESALDRAKAYRDAGADGIFIEALHDASEFERTRKEFDVPLLANMTAFGQTDLLSYETLSNIGIDLIVYPNTTMRLAMKAIEEGMAELLEQGTQIGMLDKLQQRSRLYELLNYDAYNRFGDIFDFDVPDGTDKTAGQHAAE